MRSRLCSDRLGDPALDSRTFRRHARLKNRRRRGPGICIAGTALPSRPPCDRIRCRRHVSARPARFVVAELKPTSARRIEPDDEARSRGEPSPPGFSRHLARARSARRLLPSHDASRRVGSAANMSYRRSCNFQPAASLQRKAIGALPRDDEHPAERRRSLYRSHRPQIPDGIRRRRTASVVIRVLLHDYPVIRSAGVLTPITRAPFSLITSEPRRLHYASQPVARFAPREARIAALGFGGPPHTSSRAQRSCALRCPSPARP